jgi:hypothetical protein
MIGRRVIDDAMDEQGPILHLAEHSVSSDGRLVVLGRGRTPG